LNRTIPEGAFTLKRRVKIEQCTRQTESW
jgi:hypothetical protein